MTRVRALWILVSFGSLWASVPAVVAQSLEGLTAKLSVAREEGNWQDAESLATRAARRSAELDRPLHETAMLERTARYFGELSRATTGKQESFLASDRTLQRVFAASSPAEQLDLCREVLALRQTALGPDHEWVADLHATIASLLPSSQTAEAVESFAEALRIYDLVLQVEDPGLAGLLQMYADVERAAGHLSSAEIHLRRAVGLIERTVGPDTPDHAVALNNWADTLLALGDFDAAEEQSRRALEISYAATERPSVLARRCNNLAEILLAQGKAVEASELYAEAVRLLTEHPSPGRDLQLLRYLRNQSKAHWKLGDLKLAVESAERAWDLALESEPRDEEIVVTLHNLAALLVRRELESAREAHRSLDQSVIQVAHERQRQAVERARLTGQPLLLAVVLDEFGSIARRLDRTNEALASHEEASNLRASQVAANHPSVARNEHLWGLAKDRAGFPAAEVYAHLRRAAEAYESSWRRLDATVTSFGYREPPFADLARVSLALADPNAAFLATEADRGRTLRTILETTSRAAADPETRARQSALSDSLLSLERALRQFASASATDARSVPATDIARTRSEHSRIERELLRLRRAHRGGLPTRSLEETQAQLQENTAIVGWLEAPLDQGDAERWGYVLRASGPVRWVSLPLARAERLEAVRALLRRPPAERATDLAEELRAVTAARFDPLRVHLSGVSELVVVASPEMQGCPIEALRSDTGYLVEEFEVSYAPSAFLIGRDETGAHPDQPRALLLGDPTFRRPSSLKNDSSPSGLDRILGLLDLRRGGEFDRTRLTSLPGTRQEVEAIRERFSGAEVLLGDEASEARLDEIRVRATLSDFDVIHIATHGLINDRYPLRSAVALAAPTDSTYDGFLTVREILRTWELNADLVVLSACETGLGRASGGDGFLGFVPSFLASGARSLLVSLWQADDRATRDLMTEFYGRYLESDGKSGSLAETKRGFLKGRYADPFYWAPFVLVGARN